MAEALIYGGRPGEAIPWIEAANRLGRDASKQPPPYNVWVLGMAFFGEGMFAEAIALFEDAWRGTRRTSAPPRRSPPPIGTRRKQPPAIRRGRTSNAPRPGRRSTPTVRRHARRHDRRGEASTGRSATAEDEERLVAPLRALGVPEAPSG